MPHTLVSPTEPVPARPTDPTLPFARPSAPASLSLSAVAPIEPLNVIKRDMKEADARAALADAKAKSAPDAAAQKLFTPIRFEAPPYYATAIPNLYARVDFRDGRLSVIQFRTADRVALATALRKRWGEPDGTGDTQEWAGPAWHATLRGPHDDAELTLRAVDLPADSLAGDATLFPKLSRMIGKPLADAQRTFGSAFRAETSDEDDGSAERSAGRQGFMRLTAAWASDDCTAVFHVDSHEQIDTITVHGSFSGEPGRVELFTALKTTFGPPRTVISAAGRVEVELGSGVIVRLAPGEDLELTLSRR